MMRGGESFAPSFELVLASAQRGDGWAFEQMYRLLNRRLHAFALIRRSQDPEGLVNEVFLQVFTHINRFTGNEAQFSAWLFKICRNKLIDEARRLDRRPVQTELDAVAEHVMASGPDVETTVIDRADSTLDRYFDALTDAQRDVLFLRIVAELSLEETAAILGKPTGAVKSLQRRALQALARRLPGDARIQPTRPCVVTS